MISIFEYALIFFFMISIFKYKKSFQKEKIGRDNI